MSILEYLQGLMRHNAQTPERVERSPDGSLEVVHIWKTIQGEGPFAGTPATFIRLAGCNLQCPFCDTNYTANRTRLEAEDIMVSAAFVHSRVEGGLVVITGGEPFRQNIAPLVLELARIGHKVQIETNGTIFPGNDFPWDKATVVCSPKTGHIPSGLQVRLAAMKYVLQAGKVDPFDGLPETTLGLSCRVARPINLFKGDIFVQPLDENDGERNRANLEAAIASSLKFGYRLCLQIQKIIGLP